MAVGPLRRVHRSAWIATGSMILIAVALSTTGRTAMAESFRIETKVFVGDEKQKNAQPVSETTTLFLDGVVYDFLKKPQQTAVFRKPGGGKPGRFILLSDQHSVRTEVSTERLAGFATKIRTWASHQPDPFLQFAANPEFEESFDDSTGKLVLASHLENYTVTTTQADHPDALSEYKDFLDWYTQLNTLLSHSGLPPEPRLRLNAALARHQVIPQTVELARAGEDPLRAEHSFAWLLSQDDHKRIDKVRASLSSFKDVSNEEFERLTRPKEKSR